MYHLKTILFLFSYKLQNSMHTSVCGCLLCTVFYNVHIYVRMWVGGCMKHMYFAVLVPTAFKYLPSVNYSFETQYKMGKLGMQE